MVLFALSCFGLLLFLWLAFGGPVPLKPKGYRFHTSFAEAGQLALEADVRISGVPVGKVKTITPDKQTGRADVEIQLQSRYAPLPSNAKAILRQKTLLGETYVELTPGDPNAEPIAEGGELPSTQVSDTVELDEILRSFDPKTRAAFQDWMQTQAQAITGRGRDLNDALGNLGPFAEDTATIVDILNRQEEAVTQLVSNTGIVFEALTERDGQLRSLIENTNTVFTTTAERDEELQGGVPGAADVRARVADHARAADGVRRRDRPADHAAAAGRARAVADARGPRGHRAGSAEPARTAAAADRRVREGVPGRRADARRPPAAARPARSGDRSADPGGRLHLALQARADVVLRQHGVGHPGQGSGLAVPLPAHHEPVQPGEPGRLSEAPAVQPAEPVPAAGRLRRADAGAAGVRGPPVQPGEPDSDGHERAACRSRASFPRRSRRRCRRSCPACRSRRSRCRRSRRSRSRPSRPRR